MSYGIFLTSLIYEILSILMMAGYCPRLFDFNSNLESDNTKGFPFFKKNYIEIYRYGWYNTFRKLNMLRHH